jgi:hypothetical protein
MSWRRVKSGGIVPRIHYLDSGLQEVVSFTSRPLYIWNGAPSTYWIRSRVGPSTGFDVVDKKKIDVPALNQTQNSQSSTPSASQYADKAIAAQNRKFFLLFGTVATPGLLCQP